MIVGRRGDIPKEAALDATIKELVATVLLSVLFGYIIPDNATKWVQQFEVFRRDFVVDSRVRFKRSAFPLHSGVRGGIGSYSMPRDFRIGVS